MGVIDVRGVLAVWRAGSRTRRQPDGGGDRRHADEDFQLRRFDFIVAKFRNVIQSFFASKPSCVIVDRKVSQALPCSAHFLKAHFLNRVRTGMFLTVIFSFYACLVCYEFVFLLHTI